LFDILSRSLLFLFLLIVFVLSVKHFILPIADLFFSPWVAFNTQTLPLLIVYLSVSLWWQPLAASAGRGLGRLNVYLSLLLLGWLERYVDLLQLIFPVVLFLIFGVRWLLRGSRTALWLEWGLSLEAVVVLIVVRGPAFVVLLLIFLRLSWTRQVLLVSLDIIFLFKILWGCDISLKIKFLSGKLRIELELMLSVPNGWN